MVGVLIRIQEPKCAEKEGAPKVVHQAFALFAFSNSIDLMTRPHLLKSPYPIFLRPSAVDSVNGLF